MQPAQVFVSVWIKNCIHTIGDPMAFHGRSNGKDAGDRHGSFGS